MSALLALGIHAGVLFVWPQGRFEPAEYGIETGESAVEVALIDVPTVSEHEEPAPNETTDSNESVDTLEPVVEVERETSPEPATPPPEALPEIAQMEETKPQPRPARAVAASRPKPKTAPIARKAASSAGSNSAMSGNASSSVNAVSGGITINAAYLHNPHPAYPELSRRAGHTGVVLLRVSVGQNGRVASVKLIKSSGYSLLDDRARTTVQRWTFRPARRDGKPVATEVDVPIRFRLDR
ncbi:MAG TPA: energy transducer TonB [Terrimicrobiaceae bacterium]